MTHRPPRIHRASGCAARRRSPREDPQGCHRRIRAQGIGRRARRRDRAAFGHQQDPALSPHRQQRPAVHRRSGSDLLHHTRAPTRLHRAANGSGGRACANSCICLMSIWVEHPEYGKLLASENFHGGKHVKRSKLIGEMYQQFVDSLNDLLQRGVAQDFSAPASTRSISTSRFRAYPPIMSPISTRSTPSSISTS